jgi:hypothetical protein
VKRSIYNLCIVATLLMLLPCVPAASGEYEELAAGGGTFLIEWRGDFSAGQQAKLKAWLNDVADTVILLHGSLPRPRIRIVLQPYPAGGAVPFARVIRNAPEGVHFYINPDRPGEEFVRDWTAYHEMSHLFLPYPGQRSIWFSEGMASYYQNVLQYRAGLLTEQQAWQKLYNGFERGRQDAGGDGLTLGELSAEMRKKHAFMRTYWSGALYFLEADIALRRHSDGSLTLDDVLRAYGNCCLEAQTRSTGPALAREFDRIAEAEIFVPLYESYDASPAIPDYQAVMQAAGITVVNGEIRVDPENPPSHSLQRR